MNQLINIAKDLYRKSRAIYWANYYGNAHKNLKLIGITGTDGKTTTSSLVYQVLKSAGYKAGVITTVGAFYNDKEIETGLHTTTPGSKDLHKFMREMLNAGVEYVIIETTSHALKQQRGFGLRFKSAAITNITPEHLDLHGTYKQLVKDKAKIADMSDVVYLNKEGKGFQELLNLINVKAKSKQVSYKEIPNFTESLNEFKGKFPGSHNLQNASLAFAVCEQIGINSGDIFNGLNSAIPPKGRFHYVENNLGLHLVVDFAHTANSMHSILTAVNEMRKEGEKIITLFGCPSERDVYKRPEMGKATSELSDMVILTADDPRHEDVNDINLEISKGNQDFDFIYEPDRRRAIAKSIGLAKEGDWVMLLGKGHEQSISVKGVEEPWDEERVVKEIMSSK